MKDFYTKFILLLCTAFFCTADCFGFEFNVDGFCYNVLDHDARTVEVTYYSREVTFISLFGSSGSASTSSSTIYGPVYNYFYSEEKPEADVTYVH